MGMLTASERVVRLRQLMQERSLDAYLVPSEDAHSSEYVAVCDARRAFLSGFTGSAGTALVTRDAAYLFTDGRYFVQAGQELDGEVWELKKMGIDPPLEEFMGKVLPAGSVVGFDPETLSLAAYKRMHAVVRRSTISLAPVLGGNLVDMVWGEARPLPPASRVFVHPEAFAGESVLSKLQRVVQEMEKERVNWMVVCALDEVAWLLNLRGSDIQYNPVFLSYVVIKRIQSRSSMEPDTPSTAGHRSSTSTTASSDPTAGSAVTLYTNADRMEPEALSTLDLIGVHILPYEAVFDDLQGEIDAGERVWIEPSRTNCRIGTSLGVPMLMQPQSGSAGTTEEGYGDRFLIKSSPIGLFKARKNPTELNGLRAAHVRDAVAMCRFLAHLERDLCERGVQLNEYEAAERLDALRAQQEHFVSPSFPTISSAGANAAIIHYRPTPEHCRPVTAAEIYLVDSGGQYLDGTTDITRTLHLGQPSKRERECFTRVLQGYIALERAVFPRGTTGQQLDVLARMHLWRVGLDFRHGTGHGVGCFLNVHEGPQMISFRASPHEAALEPGMTITNEPGYYEDHQFGMRFENVLLVRSVLDESQTGDRRPYYGFENITWVPADTRLLLLEMLNGDERQWLNAYHAAIRERLEPLLRDDTCALAWLQRRCAPIEVG